MQRYRIADTDGNIIDEFMGNDVNKAYEILLEYEQEYDNLALYEIDNDGISEVICRNECELQ